MAPRQKKNHRHAHSGQQLPDGRDRLVPLRVIEHQPEWQQRLGQIKTQRKTRAGNPVRQAFPPSTARRRSPARTGNRPSPARAAARGGKRYGAASMRSSSFTCPLYHQIHSRRKKGSITTLAFGKQRARKQKQRKHAFAPRMGPLEPQPCQQGQQKHHHRERVPALGNPGHRLHAHRMHRPDERRDPRTGHPHLRKHSPQKAARRTHAAGCSWCGNRWTRCRASSGSVSFSLSPQSRHSTQ